MFISSFPFDCTLFLSLPAPGFERTKQQPSELGVIASVNSYTEKGFTIMIPIYAKVRKTAGVYQIPVLLRTPK